MRKSRQKQSAFKIYPYFSYRIYQLQPFASLLRVNLQYQIMQGFLPEGRKQEPNQPPMNQQNHQNTQPVPQQREEVPIEFFIPPPINYMNSNYHQHFLDCSNPLKNLTATYKVFREELPFNTNENSQLFEFQSLESLKKKLVCSNREVYMQMLKILANQGRGNIMSDLDIKALHQNLEKKVWAYKELCLKLKVFETRNQILKKMSDETLQINQKTIEIRRELQQIKQEFKSVSTEIKIIEQFGPQQSAMQIQH